jgi:glycosyltransferase involved in cell wall biosynthesis
MGKSLVLIGFFWRPTPKENLAFALRSNLLRFLRRSAGALIAYTERGRQELIARGMEPEKVFVSHNTLDTDRLSDIAASVDPLEVEELRERVTPGMRRPLLMFLGRLLPEKGPNIAIEVLRALTRLGLSAALWVVGDGPELKSLQRLANGLPVAFFGAEYDEVRVAQYLAAADFLVIPGRVGLGCVQGFSSGVPCLTTNPDSVLQSPEVDYVIDGFNGYLVDSQDPVEYAHRIERAWRDQILYDSLCEGARATARELTMDRMVSAFVSATQFARGR